MQCLPNNQANTERKLAKQMIARKAYIGRKASIEQLTVMHGECGCNLHDDVRNIARQRVQTLFNLAREIYDEDPLLAQRYVDIARKVAMTAKLRLPRQYRYQICRHCKGFILPGANCRVRIKQFREPHVTITCLKCGKQKRIPLSRKNMRPKQ